MWIFRLSIALCVEENCSVQGNKVIELKAEDVIKEIKDV